MLSEAQTKAALKALEWPLLKAEFEVAGMNDAVLDEALGHFRRANDLIFPYPKPKREKLRTDFIEQLHKYAQDKLGVEAAERVENEAALQAKIERGYRRILETLDKCDISKLSADVRASACIGRAAHSYDHLVKRVRGAMSASEDFGLILQGPIPEEGGEPISPDAALSTIVGFLTNTLIMEAYKNKWFDATGAVVLPALPVTGEKERYMAGSTEFLATAWRAWRRTEQRLRFLGGDIQELAKPDWPVQTPKDIKKVTALKPSTEEFFDYMANERLNDRVVQNMMEMHTELNDKSKIVGLAGKPKLPPGAFVSEEEVHSAISLCEVLNYSIVDDTETPGGLRLIEWLRGYAVLKQFAADALAVNEDADHLVLTAAHDELVNLLTSAGLENEKANRFVDAVVLRESSRDLFDCPLIKSVDATYKVFGPALYDANLAQVVLSTLSSLEEPLEQRGKAFEEDTRRRLKDAGLAALGFKVKRDGEEYEYDAVLPWSEYVFVFECKHHGLSHNNPIRAYYFALEARSNIKQVLRLAAALEKHPDILKEQFGQDLSKRKVIPCVLNALPYSRVGLVDGVYFTDASALGRFFKERYSHIIVHHQINSDARLRHRVALHSSWSGAEPSAEDLILHLEKPFQLTVMASHIQLRSFAFPFEPEELFVALEFGRSAMSIESLSRVAGIKPKIVRDDMEVVALAVRDTQLEVKKSSTKFVGKKGKMKPRSKKGR